MTKRFLAIRVMATHAFFVSAALTAATLTSSASAQLALTADLPKLAETGRFEQMLSRLEENKSLAADPQVANVVKVLKDHQRHEERRNAERREAFNKAVEEMTKSVAENKLVEALVKAIEANGLADDPEAFQEEAHVKQLVEKVEKQALDAKEQQDWLEVLSVYRLLEGLFDDRGRYREQIKDAEHHVRLLRFYAPDELQKLYLARAKRRGEENPEPVKFTGDTWEQRLSHIRENMMRQSIQWAARDHVTNPGYQDLLVSGIDMLLLMAKTQGLEATFPSFADKKKVAAFRAGLEALKKKVQLKDNRVDAMLTLFEVSQLNDDTVNLPEAVLTFEFTEGSLATLDEFTSVIWPRDKENFARNTRGKFYGVGIQISMRDGQILVVSPLENTPAMKAGVKAGDVIAEVDGHDTTGWDLEQAVREITGPEGTEVTLGIRRRGVKDVLKFPIKRAEIPIESVRGWAHRDQGGWDYYIDPQRRIGYVRVSQFMPQTAEDLDAAIEQMENERGIAGLIVDLRGNPGGLLSSAIDLSDRFIKSGGIVSTVDGRGRQTSEARAKWHTTYKDFPVVMLINQGAASASEILSGAVQDHDRAFIIGERSFGKGSVQDLFPVDQGRALLKLTTQYYRLPKGRIIHRKPGAARWGIEPDLTVKMTVDEITKAMEMRRDVDVLRDAPADPADLENQPPKAADILELGVDRQLETALLVMKAKLLAKHLALAQGGAK